jgi:hypothetical protein
MENNDEYKTLNKNSEGIFKIDLNIAGSNEIERHASNAVFPNAFQ